MDVATASPHAAMVVVVPLSLPLKLNPSSWKAVPMKKASHMEKALMLLFVPLCLEVKLILDLCLELLMRTRSVPAEMNSFSLTGFPLRQVCHLEREMVADT